MHPRSLLYIGPLLSIFFLLTVVPAASGSPGTPPPADLERAIAAQRELLQGGSATASAWNDLGNLLDLHGDYDGARAAYERALELDPGQAAAHYNLALLHQAEGRLAEALKHYREVLAVDRSHAWSHYQVGRILARQGERGGAVRAYAQAFAIDPRLSFPDVNPHVLDNPLLTEALMRASRSDLREEEAAPPRRYEDPGRIAGLLVPPPATPAQPGAGNEAETDRAEPGELSTTTMTTEVPGEAGTAVPAPQDGEPGEPSSRAPAASARPATPSSEDLPTRRLTPEVLDSVGTANQATPPDQAPAAGGVRRSVTPSTRRPPPSQRTPTPSERAPGASTGRPVSPRPRFIPGTRSSAQLERRLRATAAAAGGR